MLTLPVLAPKILRFKLSNFGVNVYLIINR